MIGENNGNKELPHKRTLARYTGQYNCLRKYKE